VRRAGIILLAVVALGGVLAGGQAAAGPAGLSLDRIGKFDAPMTVSHAPGVKRLLFVVQREGTIAVMRGQHKLSHRFLDIRSRVSTAGEGGLYSVAFPPDYKKSRRFYVDYANADGDIEIDEFKRRVHSSTRARASSRRRVLVIPHPGETNHYGGQLQFGPDGELYISTGDGGGSDDSHDNARRLGKLLGKILRIDPRKHGHHRYRSPAGNPYANGPGLDEIYAYGLRNPWRFSFDRATGNIAIGDVGQNAVEEVDYETDTGAKGANFGWPRYEGNQVHDDSRPGPDPANPPISTYQHSACSFGCAVTGGYVVRDPQLSSLAGRYLYADFYVGDIHSFVPQLSGATDDQDSGLHVPQLSSFGEGFGGRIYVSSLEGPVYRLTQGG
jgi:glucose/arabinose dehydrogenase